MVEGLEDQNRSLSEGIQDLHGQLGKSQEASKETSKELTILRNRMNLSQQNWAKEREDLISAEKILREEYETTKHAMQDWEVIALEERAVRESLGERLIELEDQISTQKVAYARAVAEGERESNAVAGLQRSLQDIQNSTSSCYFFLLGVSLLTLGKKLVNKNSGTLLRVRKLKYLN